MVCRDSKSLYRTIQIEAVVAEAATRKQVKSLWRSFESQCNAFVSELRDWPGLKGVSSFVYNDKQVRINLMDLLTAPYLDSEWMPPEETWKWFKQLVSQPAKIRHRPIPLSNLGTRPTGSEQTPPVLRGLKKWKRKVSKWMR
jgi:hypothetical protein